MTPEPGPLAAARAEALRSQREREGERPTADGTRLRTSWAYRCRRQMGFQGLGIARVNPVPDEVLQAFEDGKQAHVRLQATLIERFGAEIEVPLSYRSVGIELSGHADGIYETAQYRAVAEIKSMRTWPFKRALERGPKVADLVQAGLYALAPGIDADRVHLIYLSKETGDLAEWLKDLDEEVTDPETGEVLGPLRQVVTEELDRCRSILKELDAGLVPMRSIPGVGVVRDPMADKKSGGRWECEYCGWRPLCAELSVGRVSVDALPVPGRPVVREAF